MTEKNIEYVDLHNEAALAVALAAERVASARANLELRENQLQTALMAVSFEYTEDGKYDVVDVNIAQRKVGRTKIT